MLKVEHIGIAVRNLTASVPLFERLLDCPCYKTEEVDSEKVNTAFFQKGETKIELLEDQEPGGTISRYLEKKGEGVHHIAFAVTDLEAEMRRLVDQGFTLLNDIPKRGADNKWICFLHPRDTGGVLVELCMDRGARDAAGAGDEPNEIVNR